MKKLLLVFSFFALGLFSLAQTNSAKVVFRELDNNYYNNYNNPVCVSKVANVYTSPDTASTVITSLGLSQPVLIAGEWDDIKEVQNTVQRKDGTTYTENKANVVKWYKIGLESQIGYVKAIHISLHSYFSMDNKYMYFFISHSSTKVLKFDLMNKQIIREFVLPSFRGDYIEPIKLFDWKNSNALFRVSQVDAFCGGGIFDNYIIDTKDSIYSLIKTLSYSNEDGSGDYNSSIWLPIKDSTGKFILTEKGAATSESLVFSSNPYEVIAPEYLQSDKNKLVVFKEVKNKSVATKSGTTKLLKVKNKTKYYKWNGSRLILISK